MNPRLARPSARCAASIAALAVALAACEANSTAPVSLRDDSPLQTDSLAYALRRLPGEYRAYVQATYVNRGAQPVYFARCATHWTTPMFYISRTGSDSKRRFFHDWAWACVGGVPTGVLQPGQSLRVRAPFGSIDQPSMYPPLKPEDLVGEFRIFLELCTQYEADSDNCKRRHPLERRSNAFLVHY